MQRFSKGLKDVATAIQKKDDLRFFSFFSFQTQNCSSLRSWPFKLFIFLGSPIQYVC